MLLNNLEDKLQGYTATDYCIILVGETDFTYSQNYVHLVENIRAKLLSITHTNLMICTPTYICGSPRHNYRAELFSNLLYIDIKTHGHACFFDSNDELTFDMYSAMTGKINKEGLRTMFKVIKERLVYYSEPKLDQMHYTSYTCIECTKTFFRAY